MSEITHLSTGGGPSTHGTNNAPSTVYPKCKENTEYLEAEEARTRYATQPNNPKHIADPDTDSMTEGQKLRDMIGARTNRDLHARYHIVSGRVKRNDPCDWLETHDSNGTRIAATTIKRMMPWVPTRPDGLSNVHTCKGHWVGSGRLTADEEKTLTKVDREFSKAKFAVWDAEEAVHKGEPGAQESLRLAKRTEHTAFKNKMGYRGQVQEAYPGCYTCKSEAISAAQREEYFTPSGDPSQRTIDEEDGVTTG